jgi:hypothetical protein
MDSILLPEDGLQGVKKEVWGKEGSVLCVRIGPVINSFVNYSCYSFDVVTPHTTACVVCKSLT